MTTSVAPERDRTSVADRYKWNLADLYPSDHAWRAEKERITAQLPELRAFRGQLTTSAGLLADALEARSALRREAVRLYVYALMLSDEDTRDSTHQGMTQEMTQLGSALAAESSYMEPEILRADRAGSRRSSPTSRGSRFTPTNFATSCAARRTPSATQKRGCWPTSARSPLRQNRSTTSCRTRISRTRSCL